MSLTYVIVCSFMSACLPPLYMSLYPSIHPSILSPSSLKYLPSIVLGRMPGSGWVFTGEQKQIWLLLFGNYNLVREDRFQFKIYTYILFYTILNAAKKSTIDMLLGNIILLRAGFPEEVSLSDKSVSSYTLFWGSEFLLCIPSDMHECTYTILTTFLVVHTHLKPFQGH